jgi:hypothetical protein
MSITTKTSLAKTKEARKEAPLLLEKPKDLA